MYHAYLALIAQYQSLDGFKRKTTALTRLVRVCENRAEPLSRVSFRTVQVTEINALICHMQVLSITDRHHVLMNPRQRIVSAGLFFYSIDHD
jgi:hypothetical protein